MKIEIQLVCVFEPLLLLGRVAGDPRSKTVEMKCGKQLEHNTTIFVPNFVAATDCWRSLNASLCLACLENATASLLNFLPWSEGRVLNTGCFIRYSDRDFLNKELGNSRSRETIIVIVVSVVGSVVVMAIGIVIGARIWKHRYIQKKRRGKRAWLSKKSSTFETKFKSLPGVLA